MMISVSKWNTFELRSNGSASSADTRYARNPEWNSDSRAPSIRFWNQVRILFPAYL